MAWIVANDKDDAAAADNLTGIANALHTGTNFHDSTIPTSTYAEKWKKESIALWHIDWQAPARKRFFSSFPAEFARNSPQIPRPRGPKPTANVKTGNSGKPNPKTKPPMASAGIFFSLVPKPQLGNVRETRRSPKTA